MLSACPQAKHSIRRSGHGPVTSTSYNLYTTPPQLKVTLGSGDSDVFNFDPNTLRLNKYQFNIGSQAVTGTLGWNANGSLGSLNITDPLTKSGTDGTFSDICLTRLVWLIMIGDFRRRETSRLSPGSEQCDHVRV